MESKFLIVAGSEKSGTTSLFQYLSDTDLFRVSQKKETDYLRGRGISMDGYLENFDRSSNLDSSFYLEASPGYLADSDIVSKNVEVMGVNRRVLVFLLRSPIKRLISSFLFHKTRLYIPEKLSFEKYVDLCFQYNDGVLPDELGLKEWFLRVPDAGMYYKHLTDFSEIDRNDIGVYTFDEFIRNPRAVVVAVLALCDGSFKLASEYEFHVSNETQGYKYRWLQYVVLKVNKTLEGFFYTFPSIKRFLKSIYGVVNGSAKENVTIPLITRQRLKDYYSVDILKLVEEGFISHEIGQKWIKDFGV
mgnify:CR=1 FL=1